MSFLAPVWLAAAAVVGVGLVVAHLFSTSVPPRDYLPTVRFVPEGAPLAVIRTRRISDIALLLLRLLAVALLGLALAGAHVKRSERLPVILMDASRAVRAFADVRDSAFAYRMHGAFLIAFDSAARRVTVDSLAGMTSSAARASLSAALVAAHRTVRGMSDRGHIELVIVSPAAREEVDSATARLLALWDGPVRHVRVAAADEPVMQRVSVRALGDDPVAAAVRLQIPRFARDDNRSARDDNRPVIPNGVRDLQFDVRIVRTSPTRADSLWARDSGGVVVVWPADARSSVLAPRTSADTANAIVAGPHVVVATFARGRQPRSGRAVLRWIDGEPAATEASLGRGCMREVAVPVDPIGDVVLRESFRGVIGALAEPCGGARDFASSVILRSAATKDLLSTSKQQILRSAQDDTTRVIGHWLAAFALAILIAEQLLRARARTAT